jgi:hypothetical protein
MPFRHSTLRFDPFRIEILVFLAQAVHIVPQETGAYTFAQSFTIGIPFATWNFFADSLCFGIATQFGFMNYNSRQKTTALSHILEGK